MALAIETFEDLVLIIETHPEWRRQLKRALFDIDIEATLAGLQKAVAELVDMQRQMLEVQSRQADDIHVLKTDMSQVKFDITSIKSDVGSLKGKVYEQEYRLKANGIFGRLIRRGKDRMDDVADQLHEAVAAGQVSEAELDQVLAVDLLWGGKSRQIEGDVIAVLESSWRAEVKDVEHAHRRAEILRRIGLQAVPVVAGMEWDGQALMQAQEFGVAIASNGQVNFDSWRAALSMKSGQD
jgi:hypothetical protein